MTSPSDQRSAAQPLCGRSDRCRPRRTRELRADPECSRRTWQPHLPFAGSGARSPRSIHLHQYQGRHEVSYWECAAARPFSPHLRTWPPRSRRARCEE
eukprot:scaffold59488_cov33-Tisochrysis_lutea.AAC.4